LDLTNAKHQACLIVLSSEDSFKSFSKWDFEDQRCKRYSDKSQFDSSGLNCNF
jgi:hypothetical protein